MVKKPFQPRILTTAEVVIVRILIRIHNTLMDITTDVSVTIHTVEVISSVIHLLSPIPRTPVVACSIRPISDDTGRLNTLLLRLRGLHNLVKREKV